MQYHYSDCTTYNHGISVLIKNQNLFCHIMDMYRLSDQKINPGVYKCQMELNEYNQFGNYCNIVTIQHFKIKPEPNSIIVH